jgi:hypothetical protein
MDTLQWLLVKTWSHLVFKQCIDISLSFAGAKIINKASIKLERSIGYQK